jgi:hypothetical protein
MKKIIFSFVFFSLFHFCNAQIVIDSTAFKMRYDETSNTQLCIFVQSENADYYSLPFNVICSLDNTDLEYQINSAKKRKEENFIAMLDTFGSMQISIFADTDIVLLHVDIRKNYLNKIFLKKVRKGALIFHYEKGTDVFDYPIEIMAKLDNQPTVKIDYNADDNIWLTPADYLAKIHTNPPVILRATIKRATTQGYEMKYNGELMIDAMYPDNNVDIYEEEDNGWRKFATIPITGNIDSQTIKLQEGLYLAKVKRLKDKTENLMYVHIKSNFRTTIELIETKDHYFPDDEKPIKISDH